MRYVRARMVVPAVLAALVCAVGAEQASASSVVGLWHMDENSGSSMVDASGQGNDGSLSGVAFVTPGFDGTGGAYAFDGVSSKVIVPDDPSLSPGDADVTITAHVNLTVAPSAAVVDYDLVRKKGQQRMYRMEILSSGAALCTFKGSTAGKSVRGGPNLADGSWHTIVCAKTATGISLSVDGTTISKTVTIGSISNTTALVLGGQLSGSQDLYHGVMDEVSIAIG